MISSFNRETSVRKSSTSLEGGGGAIEAMEGGATSRTLSARVASSSRLRVTGGGEYHSHVPGEALEKELTEEWAASSGGIVSEKLLHLAE